MFDVDNRRFGFCFGMAAARAAGDGDETIDEDEVVVVVVGIVASGVVCAIVLVELLASVIMVNLDARFTFGDRLRYSSSLLLTVLPAVTVPAVGLVPFLGVSFRETTLVALVEAAPGFLADFEESVAAVLSALEGRLGFVVVGADSLPFESVDDVRSAFRVVDGAAGSDCCSAVSVASFDGTFDAFTRRLGIFRLLLDDELTESAETTAAEEVESFCCSSVDDVTSGVSDDGDVTAAMSFVFDCDCCDVGSTVAAAAAVVDGVIPRPTIAASFPRMKSVVV
jgi:hypothetical protein